MLNKEENQFLYVIYKYVVAYRYVTESFYTLEDFGYIKSKHRRIIDVDCREISLTRKGIEYIESLSVEELLKIDEDLWLAEYSPKEQKLYKSALSKLNKSELCIYLVHNNKYIRNIAKEVYDGK